MAVTLFDIEFSLVGSQRIEGVDSDERSTLFAAAEVSESKPKRAGALSTNATAEPESEDLSFEELSEGYTELIARADDILKTLEERASKLDYVFDPNIEVALGESTSAIFGVNNRITYKMYLAALRLDKDIAVEIGESESGITR